MGIPSLLDAIRSRRSRRFGRGMRMPSGPMEFTSRQEPVPLSEEEEALLAFAACGITGHALGDLVYGPDGGGEIMAGLGGRTAGSGDAIHTVSVVVVNSSGTSLLKRPRDFPGNEIDELARMAQEGRFIETYSTTSPKPWENASERTWNAGMVSVYGQFGNRIGSWFVTVPGRNRVTGDRAGAAPRVHFECA